MPLQLLPAEEADLPRSIFIENKAYANAPLGGILFPGPFPPDTDPNSRASKLAKQKRETPGCHWVKVVDTDLEAQEGRDKKDAMIAFSSWFVYDTPLPADPPPNVWGPEANVEACELLFGAMREEYARLLGGQRHVYLKLLHTEPEHQRRGAASMLMQWGVDEADKLGVPAYLEATEEGYPLYKKFGFEEVSRLTQDFSKWNGPKAHDTYLMLRPASK